MTKDVELTPMMRAYIELILKNRRLEDEAHFMERQFRIINEHVMELYADIRNLKEKLGEE